VSLTTIATAVIASLVSTAVVGGLGLVVFKHVATKEFEWLKATLTSSLAEIRTSLGDAHKRLDDHAAQFVTLALELARTKDK